MSSQPKMRLPVSEWGKFNPAVKDRVRKGFIFDSAIYAAAGQDQLVMCISPAGGQLNDNSRVKTEADTNLFTAGTLSNNQKMLVTSIQVLFFPSTLNAHAEADAGIAATTNKSRINDIAAFYESGLLHLALKGNDIVKDGPLMLFPPCTHIDGHVSMTGTDTDNNRTVEFATVKGNAYPIEPFEWNGGESITAKLLWPNGKVALPSGLTGRVQIRLFGDIAEIR
jgi:hypothetical protein